MIVLKFKYPSVVTNLPTLGPRLITKLSAKLNSLMLRLSSKIVGETIPEFFPDGAPMIAASVREIPTTQSGTTLAAFVEGGGPTTTKVTLGGANAGKRVDYAGVQEAGVPHPWEIQPVLFASAQFIGLKKRALAGLPTALRFTINGKTVFARRVTHPGLEPRPFMQKALDGMKVQIVAELEQTVVETIQGK